MSSSSEKADLIAAPFAAADAVGRKGVFRTAALSAAGNIAIPTRFRRGHPTADPAPGIGQGLYVRLKARNQGIQVAFAPSAVTLVVDQASTWGTGHAQAGFTIEAGESIDVLIPSGATHLCYVPLTGSNAVLEGFISEAPAV